MSGNTQLTALFLKQSLLDSQSEYAHALSKQDYPRFDVVAITASNEHQAEVFRAQLATRDLPKGTEFVVLPDKNGERVGSGGATLSVIKYVTEKYGSFKGLRVACLHSGGDGKRTPNYSALGKLFSPVPRVLPNGKPSTLFDEFMIGIAGIPGRIKEGMLLLSGDVLLLFNPLQIDFNGHGAAAISFKEDAETGKDHGVFLKGSDGNVRRFLHKQSVATLTEMGAVDERGNCSIDTGAILFAPDLLADLYSLVKTAEGEANYINSTVRLSLYGDFLYPLATDSTLEQFYLEQPEGVFCNELQEARTRIWNLLSKYKMKLLNLAPAKFVHFGTTREITELMTEGYRTYESLGWCNQINSAVSGNTAAYNSILSRRASIGKGCYLECSYVHQNATVGNNCLLSFVDIHGETVPDNVVLHGIKQQNGQFVCRIYGINDNPKAEKLFGIPLADTGLTTSDTLWNAEIYPACDTIQEAVKAALNLYDLVHGKGDWNQWRKTTKKSLCSGFNDADPVAIVRWINHMEDLVHMNRILHLAEANEPASKAKEIMQGNKLKDIQLQWLKNYTAQLDLTLPEDFSKAIRLYWYLGVALDDENYQGECFKIISKVILDSAKNQLQFNDSAVIAKEKSVVSLPLRVNWGGGWSDTPPHCIEQGGIVLNAAITLNGALPVEVTFVKIPEKKIVFDSRDMDVHGEFDTIEPLQDNGNPYDPFALQKACLLACGIIPMQGNNLCDILTRMGGGFEMHTEVTGVPKGSGLGTSSILSAACVKALFEFLGMPYTDDDLVSHVLVMEQLMSTGGGWQDQVGGVTKGIKYITAKPGITQKVNVEYVEISEKTKQELNERFCLIYTGQRRLARNLLRDVVGRYVGNEPNSIFAHKEIQKVALQMRTALEQGDIDGFAELLDYHWKLSKMIDEGTTNTLLEHILTTVEDLVDGRFVSGAGGGGFLQVILKKGVTHLQVHQRLKEVFQDFDVDVWDCRITF